MQQQPADVKEIAFSEPLEAWRLITAEERFILRIPSLFAAMIPKGVGIRPLTAEEMTAIVVIAALVVFAGLATYAISKGYRVTRTSESGEVWEFTPRAWHEKP